MLNFSIPKVDLQQHAGLVTCRLENVHGTQEESGHLNILAAPLITTQLPKQEETVSGKRCNTKSSCSWFDPRTRSWTWFYNDTTSPAPENTTYDEEKSEYHVCLVTF